MRQEASVSFNLLAIAGFMLVLVGLFMNFGDRFLAQTPSSQPDICQGEINPEVALSREQIAQLLIVPERDAKTRVHDLLSTPYCRLPELQVRAGVAAERLAYPLAFKPQTWLIVLYEGDEYAGYQFRTW